MMIFLIKYKMYLSQYLTIWSEYDEDFQEGNDHEYIISYQYQEVYPLYLGYMMQKYPITQMALPGTPIVRYSYAVTRFSDRKNDFDIYYSMFLPSCILQLKICIGCHFYKCSLTRFDGNRFVTKKVKNCITPDKFDKIIRFPYVYESAMRLPDSDDESDVTLTDDDDDGDNQDDNNDDGNNQDEDNGDNRDDDNRNDNNHDGNNDETNSGAINDEHNNTNE